MDKTKWRRNDAIIGWRWPATIKGTCCIKELCAYIIWSYICLDFITSLGKLMGTGEVVSVLGYRCPSDALDCLHPTQGGVLSNLPSLLCHTVTGGMTFQVRGEPGLLGG